MSDEDLKPLPSSNKEIAEAAIALAREERAYLEAITSRQTDDVVGEIALSLAACHSELIKRASSRIREEKPPRPTYAQARRERRTNESRAK